MWQKNFVLASSIHISIFFSRKSRFAGLTCLDASCMRYWDQVGPQNKRVNIATVPNFAFCDYEPHGLYGFTTRGAPHCTDCKLFSLSLSLSLHKATKVTAFLAHCFVRSQCCIIPLSSSNWDAIMIFPKKTKTNNWGIIVSQKRDTEMYFVFLFPYTT